MLAYFDSKRALQRRASDAAKSITELGKGVPLQWLHVNGVAGLTDPSISAVARSCSRMLELELCDLPLLSALSLRDVWMFSRCVDAIFDSG